MTTTKTERTQRERSEATTRALLDAARDLFAREGYANTSLDDVAAAAGVTKGALYHHFDGKQDLFRAVVVRGEEELNKRLTKVFLAEKDPLRGLYAACREFLEAAQEPAFQRIHLTDSLSVLSFEERRRLLTEGPIRLMGEGLKVAAKAGAISPRSSVEPLAHMMHGAMCEGARLVAAAKDPKSQARIVLGEVKRMVESLAATPSKR